MSGTCCEPKHAFAFTNKEVRAWFLATAKQQSGGNNMVARIEFYFKDYKRAIMIVGKEPHLSIDYYFPTKRAYEQFKQDYLFSQGRDELVNPSQDKG